MSTSIGSAQLYPVQKPELSHSMSASFSHLLYSSTMTGLQLHKQSCFSIAM